MSTDSKSLRQIVEAGAGCGKTTGLVARYRAAIGCPDTSDHAPEPDPRYTRTVFHPSEVLALTFTNEAAEQMKKRIIQSLENDGENALAQRVLEDAQICTYHSYCLRIIQPHLEKLGYDNALLSPEVARLHRRKDLMRAFADFPEAPLLRQSLKLEDCIDLATKFLSDSSFRSSNQGFSPEASIAWHEEALQRFESFRDRHLDEAKNKVLQLKNTNWITKWIAVLEGDQSTDVASLRFSLPKEPEVLNPSFVQDAKDLKAFYKNGFREALREENISLESEALRLFQQFLNFSQDYLGKYLDFDAVEQELHTLLKNNPRAIVEAPKLILVDEFQDTNPQQFAIIESLSEPETQWYFVGDPKQSIYAFRKSDVSLFYKMREKLELIQFDTNYRSDVAILNLVNRIQMEIFDPKKDPLDPPAQHLNFPESKEINEKNSGEVQIFHLEKSSDPLQAAAEELPKLLAKNPEDSIAILFRSWKKLYTLAQTLRETQLPFEISGSENPFDHILTEIFCDYLEHQELSVRYPEFNSKHSKWQAAQSMWGREALADVSGPARLNIFGSSVGHNISILGDWQQLLVEFCEHIDLGSFEKSKTWVSCLSRWLKEQSKLGLSETLSPLKLAFFLKKHTKEIKMKSPYPVPSTQITLMTLHASKGLEFDHVLLPELFERSSSRTEKSLESEEGDAVVSFDLSDAKGQPIKSLRHSQQRLLDTAKKYAEEKRLFYVALTRAKSRLSVFARETGSGSSESSDGEALNVLGVSKARPPYWNALVTNLPKLHGVSSNLSYGEQDRDNSRSKSNDADNNSDSDQQWFWPKQSRPTASNQEAFLRLGVSSYLALDFESDLESEIASTSDSNTPNNTKFTNQNGSHTSSSELGNAFHALIEKTRLDPSWLTQDFDKEVYESRTLNTLSRLDFSLNDNEKPKLCEALLMVYQLPELNELWRDALQSPEKVQREFGLFVLSEKYRLTGFADLIHFKSADELVLIDWKTSRRLSTLKRLERIEKFRAQLKIYADAFAGNHSGAFKKVHGLIVGVEISDTPHAQILFDESLI